jgi:hypothetical protein
MCLCTTGIPQAKHCVLGEIGCVRQRPGDLERIYTQEKCYDNLLRNLLGIQWCNSYVILHFHTHPSFLSCWDDPKRKQNKTIQDRHRNDPSTYS